ncbi:MAG: methylenetetrahydrofolate reductase [Deltaproteobacteria bacterium]|nr:methylenetetrahydrofolate reductase [Deltaproteobacteria bacterium]
MTFQQRLAEKPFTITAEIGPPKGTDTSQMLTRASKLKDRVHAMNVTDNQSSVMRMSSLAACHLLREEGIEPIYQLTCRDRNRLALQSDLLSASALGIRNVLALTGDHPQVGDHPQAKPVFDVDSTQLLQIIGRLNTGRDFSTQFMNKPLAEGTVLKGKTDLFPGAAVCPEANPIKPQLLRFSKKVAAGAKFFQTQAVFDLEKFKNFMRYARDLGAKVLAGILFLKSAGMARYLIKNVPGITVPDHVIREMESSSHPLETGVRIAARQIEQLQGMCDGVHIMAMGMEEKVLDILDEAGM